MNDDLEAAHKIILEVRNDLEKLLWKTGMDDFNHAVNDAFQKLDRYIEARKAALMKHYRDQIL